MQQYRVTRVTPNSDPLHGITSLLPSYSPWANDRVEGFIFVVAILDELLYSSRTSKFIVSPRCPEGLTDALARSPMARRALQIGAVPR